MPVSAPSKTETPEALDTWAFAGFKCPSKSTPKLHLTTALTTDSEIFRNRKSINPGVAQLVARLVWDQEAQSSNLCTRTKSPLKSVDFSGFFLEKAKILYLRLPPVSRVLKTGFFFVYCAPEFAYSTGDIAPYQLMINRSATSFYDITLSIGRSPCGWYYGRNALKKKGAQAKQPERLDLR